MSFTAAHYTINKNAQKLNEQLSSHELCKMHGNGAYTTMTTVNKTSIFRYKFHVDRLVNSLATIPGADLGKETEFRARVTSEVRACAQRFREETKNEDDELRITVVVTPAEKGALQTPSLDIFVHTSAMSYKPNTSSGHVKVQLTVADRPNWQAKTTAWVKLADQLKQDKPADVEEIVLLHEDSKDKSIKVMEGLSSNAFVVEQEKTVRTADHGVLGGSVRSVVLDVLRNNPVTELSLQAPQLSNWKQWTGFFITSTSRRVLPVEEVIVPPSLIGASIPKTLRFTYPEKCKTLALRAAVDEAMLGASDPVL